MRKSFWEIYATVMLLLTWMITLLDLTVIRRVGMIFYMVIPIAVIVLYAVVTKKEIPVKSMKDDLMAYRSLMAGAGLFLVGFVSMWIAGGGPDMANGQYIIISRGQTIRTISKGLYIYLCMADCMFADGLVLLVAATLKRMVKKENE